MRRSNGVWALALFGAAILACRAAPAHGANKIDEKLAASLGKDVVEAAHPTAKDISLLEYKESTKDDRLVLSIKMKYHGKVTKAKYTSNVTITLDLSKDPPKVVDVVYKDDNKVPASKKRLKAVGDQLAKRLLKKI
jgi:hypothetical protein